MKLIVLEFNELCPSLIRDLMEQGLLPGFRDLYSRSSIFTTDAGEDPPTLEPWIQWPTVHSGMTLAEHRVHRLGAGHELKTKCMGELLSDAGIRVGIFGSMNMNYGKLNGYFLPDPWHKIGSTWPRTLEIFYRVVSKQVQESSKVDSFTKSDMLKLAFFMSRNGLTLDTAATTIRQLLAERMKLGVYWRRASLLDHISYDLFRRLNHDHRVEFATFFSNSTAHYQHYFWRNMEPEIFDFPPPEGSPESLKGAIVFGYKSMDKLISRVLSDYPTATVILCTALSQKPWMDATKCSYRPKSFDGLLAFASVRGKVKPVMAEEFRVVFSSKEVCDSAEQKLSSLTVDGQPLMRIRRDNSLELFGGCAISNLGYEERFIDGSRTRFKDLFYMTHGAIRSGLHDRSGVLWIGNGKHRVVARCTPLTDIAPTVLAHFGVSQPDYMGGRSLLANRSYAA